MNSTNTPENSLDPILLSYINDKFGAGKKDLLLSALMWSYNNMGQNIQDAYINELSDSNDYTPEERPDRIFTQVFVDIKEYLLKSLGIIISPLGNLTSIGNILEIAEFVSWTIDNSNDGVIEALLENDDIDDSDKIDILASEYDEDVLHGFAVTWNNFAECGTNDLIRLLENNTPDESHVEEEVEVQTLEDLPETEEDAQIAEVAKVQEDSSLIVNFGFASVIIKEHYPKSVGASIIDAGVSVSSDIMNLWLASKQIGVEFKTADDFVSLIALSNDAARDPFRFLTSYGKQLYSSEELIAKVTVDLPSALARFKDFYSKRF